MAKLLLLNKPFQVLSQFTDSEGRQTLAKYISDKHLYPAGRLDWDSEGLLLLTDDGQLQARISQPEQKIPKTYLVQVEGMPDAHAIKQLEKGVELKDGLTRPAKARLMEEPPLWPRNPPIRERKNVPDSWLELTITEGRNRQVRRMTAAVGHPTLRLVRWQIGDWTVEGLAPGESREISVNLPQPRRQHQHRRASGQQPSGHARGNRPTARRRR